jgi:hypothetical protein
MCVYLCVYVYTRTHTHRDIDSSHGTHTHRDIDSSHGTRTHRDIDSSHGTHIHRDIDSSDVKLIVADEVDDILNQVIEHTIPAIENTFYPSYREHILSLL